MFNSMTPHKTSMVEFPVFAIVMIWFIRIIEQTVVSKPNKNTQTSANFFLMLILRRESSGMGRKKITTSKNIVTAANP